MTSSTPQGHIEDVLRRFDVQSFLLLAVSVPQDAVDSTSKPKETLDGKKLGEAYGKYDDNHPVNTVHTAFSLSCITVSCNYFIYIYQYSINVWSNYYLNLTGCVAFFHQIEGQRPEVYHTLSFKQFHSTVALMQTRPGKCKQCATVDSMGKSTLCWRNMLVLVSFSKQTDDDDDDDDDDNVISERWHDFHVCYCILRDNLLWLCVGQIFSFVSTHDVQTCP